MINQVTIFCSSSNIIDKAYKDDATKLTKILCEQKIDIICGGGETGLMGVLTDTYLMCDKANKIIGVRPKFLNDIERGHKNLSELILVETMHERKAKMIENTNAIVVLPGGCGTFEELFEILTLKRLGQFNFPIVLLNTKNFFEPFLSLFYKMIDENFMHKLHLSMFSLAINPESVLVEIKKAFQWKNNFTNFAILK
ncbi:MAG: Rossman fold protein, TIGR00730 family [Bacteroidetes bacterium GWF2_38_335]|nr:MAG: Rossman fold protein, TIGR00730 family [Bacteroidetes bacterium GWF2_38_335]OFY80361.1 MAG: Rossman fold protein, TIGR00730 family [Bacteroidetes bacterium RIFOXYA12_FULL_38_20]HBS88838.1 TIGR00730 family Rossman fold protein [Bacteroidales bacterium]